MWGCLCYPRVLGTLVVAVHPLHLDLLEVLTYCKEEHKMSADWWRGPVSSCPPLDMDDGMAQILAKVGEVPMVEAPQPWSWSNLLQGGQTMADSMLVDTLERVILGPRTFDFVLGLLLALPIVFFVTHYLLLMRMPCLARGYRGLTPLQQVVTCTHMVYGLLLGLQLGPYTYYALRTLFKVWTAQFITSTEVTAVFGAFMMLHALMYLVEGCLRSVHFSWLLLVHHEVFFLIVGMCIWTRNTVVFSLGVVLDLFVVHEAPLYWSLVAYRLGLVPQITRGLLLGACGWYVITRFMQTAMLGYMIASLAQMATVRYTPEFIITSVLCGLLTGLQFYTLQIYKNIYDKVRGPAETPKGDEPHQDPDGESLKTQVAPRALIGVRVDE